MYLTYIHIVAIGLINHNVTYLLSSEIPALRNGHYRPMPFRAAEAPKEPDNQQAVEPHLVVQPCHANGDNSLQNSPSIRSRSNSYVLKAAASRPYGKKEQFII